MWNPCFDVAPGRLIEGIITERGMVPKAAGEGSGGGHNVRGFMSRLGLWQGAAGGRAGWGQGQEEGCDACAKGRE